MPRRSFAWFASTIVLAVAIAGCAPAQAPSPTAPLAKAPLVEAKPSPAAAKSEPAKPQPPAYQQEWDKLVAAAKKEGRLVISANPAAVWREGITGLWSEAFPEIQIEYSGSDGRNFWPKVKTERDAGQYLWDLRVGGPDQDVYANKQEWFEPIRPMLLLPEVTDDSKWFGGLDGLFADVENRYFVGFTAYTSKVGDINRDAIPLPELRTVNELLDPKWKGKIVLQDPRGGSGLAMLTVLLAGMGEGFVRNLLTTQDVIVTNDSRQMVEWIIRARYPIGLGASTSQLNSFKEQGVPFNLDQIPEGPISVNIGAGGLEVLSRAPNPNAARVFANWILTRDVQRKLTEKVVLNSRRTDVPAVDAETALDVNRVKEYIANQDEDLLPMRQRAQAIASELLR